jgi:hypothetical protein
MPGGSKTRVDATRFMKAKDLSGFSEIAKRASPGLLGIRQEIGAQNVN